MVCQQRDCDFTCESDYALQEHDAKVHGMKAPKVQAPQKDKTVFCELCGKRFANSSNLHVLNLARNRLAKVEQGSIDGLVELRALRLDNNALADINGLVSSLEKLKWLNVSSNRLQWFDYAFVPRSLEWLDVHGNQIEELGNYYKLEGEFRDDT